MNGMIFTFELHRTLCDNLQRRLKATYNLPVAKIMRNLLLYPGAEGLPVGFFCPRLLSIFIRNTIKWFKITRVDFWVDVSFPENWDT